VDLIPKLLEELPSGVPYIDNSPHGGPEAQSPANGDGHIWGSFFNSFKDPLFVTETCWSLESYSHPETLKEVMGLDPADYASVGWPKKWKADVGLNLLIRNPFSAYFMFDSLTDYIKALEIEQALADHHALSNFRLFSPSNNGVVYWSFNKGGPLFQFGSIDYKLRPMMSYYVVTRLWQDIVVGIRRDGNSIRVTGSNKSLRPVDAVAELLHVNAAGKILKEWKTNVTLPAGPSKTIFVEDDLYPAVINRNEEAVYTRLSVGGVLVSEELFLLVPMAEFQDHSTTVKATAKSVGKDIFELEVSASGLAKVVEIKAPYDVLVHENFFPLLPGSPKKVTLTSISGATIAGSAISVKAFDGGAAAELTL